MSFGPTEWIVILVVVLLLFGSTRLPKLARSMGQASKEFKQGLSEGISDDDAGKADGAPKTDGAKTDG